MKPSSFRLERFFGRYEFAVPHLLAASDSESVTVADLLAGAPDGEDRLRSLWLGYTESTGAPDLRAAIAGIYERRSSDEVLVCAGAEEAIFAFVHGVLSPGDHVIVQWPCYQSVMELPASIGCDVTRWVMDASRGWTPDVDALAAAIRPTTKALFINTPHNPTGYHFPRAAFDRVLALARHHGLLVFSDEVYRELEHDPATRLPAACDVYEHAVSLGVMSKSYGLAGLRIGWVATSRADVREAMVAMKDYLTICSSAPSELLATIALGQRERLVARNRAIAVENVAALDAFFGRHPELFAWARPHAGPIAFPRLLGGRDADAFCADLIARAGVMLAPGSLFDHPGHFRIGFGRRRMVEALRALEAALPT
ncbi:MAG: aminotransferase class I/II-fold pyridoxal phosphate-dependent enzyme [Vicinamibacterales bacterium]